MTDFRHPSDISATGLFDIRAKDFRQNRALPPLKGGRAAPGRGSGGNGGNDCDNGSLAPARLSASSLIEWLRCPMLWAGRRVWRWPEPPAHPALAMGAALHAAFAAHHRGQDAELALLAAWAQVERAPYGALQRASNAVRAYAAANPAQFGDRAEVAFTLESRALPCRLIGYYDLVRGEEVHEIKTGMTAWTQARVDRELQATAYLYAWRELRGELPPLTYWTVDTGSHGRVQRLVTQRTAWELEEFAALAGRIYGEMERAELAARCMPSRCVWPERCAAWRRR